MNLKLLFLILIFLHSNISFSQWLTDPAQNTPVCTAPNNQYAPQIVVDENGNSIIVWEDETDPVGYRHIYAQRLNRYGYKMWDERGVPVCTAREYKIIADVISDGHDGAIVVWTDWKNFFHPEPIEELDIYAQRIDSTGALLWEADGVAVCTEEGNQYFRKLIKNNDESLFLIWEDWRISRSNAYMQRVTEHGVTLLPENGIKFLPESSLYCDAVTDGLNGFFICFAEYYDATMHFYAQRIDSLGKKIWIDSVSLAHGGWAITDDANGFIVTDGKWAQRVNKFGEPLWGENGVYFNDEINEMSSILELAIDGQSGVYLTWTVTETIMGNRYLYFARVDSIGELSWLINYCDNVLGWSTNQGQHIVAD